MWLAIGSQLSYLKGIYGPRVFLHINIAYYAPSIPILLLESVFNQIIESKVGVSTSILARGAVALCGYGALTLSFPFIPESQVYLLMLVSGVGMFSSLAFSASYQLGARFSSASIVALGMGGSASGPLVLILELLFRIDARPSFAQFIALFSVLTVLTCIGLWCLSSLLTRNWDAVNESIDTCAPTAAAAEDGNDGQQQRRSLLQRIPTLGRRDSTASVLAYNMLEPHSQPYVAAGEDWFPAANDIGLQSFVSRDFSGILGSFRKADDDYDLATRVSVQPQDSDGEEALSFVFRDEEETEASGPWFENVGETYSQIWPCLLAMLIQCSTSLTVLPFFTYAPSSGLLDQLLPKYLFFLRLFGDLLGRWLPRLPALTPRYQHNILLISCIKLIGTPLYFIYINAGFIPYDDVILLIFVVVMWLISGYVNSASNMLAPTLVDPHLKSTAAGMMALTYQIGHFAGLTVASALSYALF